MSTISGLTFDIFPVSRIFNIRLWFGRFSCTGPAGSRRFFHKSDFLLLSHENFWEREERNGH